MNAAPIDVGAGRALSGLGFVAAHARESVLDVGAPLRKAFKCDFGFGLLGIHALLRDCKLPDEFAIVRRFAHVTKLPISLRADKECPTESIS